MTNALYPEIFCEENIAIQNLFSLYQMPEFTNPSQIATRCVVSSGSPTSKSPTSEVRLSESISHQKVPPQLLCFICTSIALFGLWGSWDMCTKGLMGIFVAEIDEITKVENSRKYI